MRMRGALAFVAIVTCLSTPACQTIPIGSDQSDAKQDGPAASDAATDLARSCNDPGYGCTGNKICKPLRLGGWACFAPGTEP